MVKGLEPILIPHPREADEPISWPASPNYCSASWWPPGPLASPHMITNPALARIKDIVPLNQNVQRRPKHSSLTCGQSESSFLLQRVECVLGQVVWSAGVGPHLGNSCLRTGKTLPWHMHVHMCSNGEIGSILSQLGTIPQFRFISVWAFLDPRMMLRCGLITNEAYSFALFIDI